MVALKTFGSLQQAVPPILPASSYPHRVVVIIVARLAAMMWKYDPFSG